MRTSVKRLLLVGVALSLLLSAAGGALAQDGETGESGRNVDTLVGIYNANVDEAPGIARDRFADETFELRVGSGDTVATKTSGEVYRFETNADGEIVAHGQDVDSEPSIRVRTSESTFDAIVNAEDPAEEFDAQYEAGNIEIAGLSLTKALEVELAKFAVWLGKTFGFL